MYTFFLLMSIVLQIGQFKLLLALHTYMSQREDPYLGLRVEYNRPPVRGIVHITQVSLSKMAWRYRNKLLIHVQSLDHQFSRPRYCTFSASSRARPWSISARLIAPAHRTWLSRIT